ncbi:MAG: hypothetical protein ACYCSN_10180 [Acidobacteriaceae bacterium]
MYPTPAQCRPFLDAIERQQARIEHPERTWQVSAVQAAGDTIAAAARDMLAEMLGPEPGAADDPATVRERAHYAASAVAAIAYAQDEGFAEIMADHWLARLEGKTGMLARSLARLWGDLTRDLLQGACNARLLAAVPPDYQRASMREALTATHLDLVDDAPFTLASAMALGYLVDISEWQLTEEQREALMGSDLLKEILSHQLLQSARPYLWAKHPQSGMEQKRHGALPVAPDQEWATRRYRKDLDPDAYIEARGALAPERRIRMLPIAPAEFLHLAEHRDRLCFQERLPAMVSVHAGIPEIVAQTRKSIGFGFHFEDAGAMDPCCDWRNHRIHMPPLERFATQADYLAALLHEIGHAVGHERISALAYGLPGLSPQMRLQEECAADGFVLAFAREHPEIPVDLALFAFDQVKGTRWAYPVAPDDVIHAAYLAGEECYRRLKSGEPLAIWRHSEKVLRESPGLDHATPPATAPPVKDASWLFQTAVERLERDMLTMLNDPAWVRHPGDCEDHATRARQMSMVAMMLPRMETLDRLHRRVIQSHGKIPLEWENRCHYFTELRGIWISAGLTDGGSVDNGRTLVPPSPPRRDRRQQTKGRSKP